jgi:hypothetical protein
MGQARRNKLYLQNDPKFKKRNRFFHLMKIVSKYDEETIKIFSKNRGF